MPIELNLRFPDPDHVIVRLGPDDDGSGQLTFTNPITEKDLRDLQWYVEVYAAHSLGDPDDKEAGRIAGRLPVLGKALFDAVFGDREAQRRLNRFQDSEDETRLLTISAESPSILALPWELLHDSASGGGYLFRENPRISIRRRVAGATGGRGSFKAAARDSLHLLFVVSRPDDAGFLDPRVDTLPVLDAIDEHAPGRVTCEFLRPATLDALIERLEDERKTPVDILHFDGHGVFDRKGGLPERAAKREGSRFPFDDTAVKDKAGPSAAASPPNTGYLLFEQPDGKADFVPAEKVGANLHRHKVSLVILSACQSAAVGEKDKDVTGTAEGETKAADERPMGSVAARLTATGIPSVLAMTHSVLVHTTRALFGAFYKELARHKAIGESLDNARRQLANHPEKYQVQRGLDRVWLKLQDWFLPALYQQGADGALLLPADGSRLASAVTGTAPSNLPKAPEAGFFGRRRDLWHIERWFAGPTRRISITGFGGQGKTALAQEAGRWLTRTGLFRAAVFVDYSRVQAVDAVAVAVSNIGSVLGETLIDAKAATQALTRTPTLVILDNLEALAKEPLTALLDAAVAWSGAGASRVLCTTRRPDFDHADYRVEGTLVHRRIVLDGLGRRTAPDDALEWFAKLDGFPPPPTWTRPPPEEWRRALVDLFDRVKFHPLSIRVLAQQLKTRRPAELGERLEQLLAKGTADAAAPAAGASEDTPAGLLASIQLSLDQLDAAAREALPRLGVFQGGAMEHVLLSITGLGETGERDALEKLLAAIEGGDVRAAMRAMGQSASGEVPTETLAHFRAKLPELADKVRAHLAQLPPPSANLWPALRRQLEAAALIEAEAIPGVTVPFLRFHPTLAPMLWAQLGADDRTRLSAAHRRQYYVLSRYLYHEDDRHPHEARAIARWELPNLLHAVHAALDAGDPHAVDFSVNVNKFLRIFGLKPEAESLAAKAQAAAGDVGSQAWFLAQSNRGEQLYAARDVAEATKVFRAILKHLGDSPTYDRAVTLGRLGRCFRAGGQPDLAAQSAREAIAVCDKLMPTDGVKRLRGQMHTGLANALLTQGRYAEARQAYVDGLAVARELNDPRGQGVTLGQLGALALAERRLPEAEQRYRAALALFQQLHEPASEATCWHQLGIVFQKAGQWNEAERHYRESARIKEERGNLPGAAATWNSLALVSKAAGKRDAAESWLRKAIEGGRRMGDLPSTSGSLNNLANLLQSEPGRLPEARQLAEEALAIMTTLDPGAATIWTTYNILAEIADREAALETDAGRQAELQAQAREHRRLARETKRALAGTRHEIQELLPIVLLVIAAVTEPEVPSLLEQTLLEFGQHGWTKLVAAIRRILAGERNADALCADLDSQDSMIIETILQGLADPSSLADLMPREGPPPVS